MKKFYYSTLLIYSFIFLWAQKNKQTLPTNEMPPPEWVSQRPVSASKYIGIGVASKDNPNYMLEAKKNALYDLTSEIKVNISSNSMLYSVQNNNTFSQNFNSLINLKTVEDLEGYEQVGVYENDKQYWVFYQLDKQEYQRQKEQKKKNILSKSAELIRLALIDAAQKNYTAELRKKIQAFSLVVPYLNEEVDFSSYHIPGIKNIFDLTQDIQITLQAIQVEMPKKTAVLKPYQQKYAPIQTQCFIYKDPFIQFPFRAIYDEDVLHIQERAVSQSNGILEIVPIYVQGVSQTSYIEVQPDLDALIQNDSVATQTIQFLKSFIQMPKFRIPVSIQPITLYLQVREFNLGKSASTSVIKNFLFNKLNLTEISIINDSTQADYIVKVFSNTAEDEHSEDLQKRFHLFLAQLRVDIYLYNKEKQILFNSSIQDVYGYGSTLLLAGSNAYTSERLFDRLNKELFYLKRKILWY